LDQSALIFSLLMFSFIAISSSYIFGTLLTANGNMRQLNIIAGSSVLVSLLINFLLIPRLQAVGSAYASLGSQFVTGIIQIIVVQRIFGFRINYRYLTQLLVFVVGVILLGIISVKLPYSWKINFVMMLSGSCLLILPMRLIRIRELIRILKSDQK